MSQLRSREGNANAAFGEGALRESRILRELARVYVVDALKRWEPRVVVTSVKATREQQDGENVLALRLRYNVISTNTPGNNVILSGIEQTVRL